MTLKKMLGLETFPISDEEITRQLHEAFQSQREVIEFVSGSRRVRVRVPQVSAQGIMREYDAYYAR